MNSGLYAFAGASATATAAACAKRLLDPMTNVSNVYLGLSRAWVGAARGSPGPPPGTSLGRWCSAPKGPAGWAPRWTPGWPLPGTGGTPAGPAPAGGAPAGATSVGSAPEGATPVG